MQCLFYCIMCMLVSQYVYVLAVSPYVCALFSQSDVCVLVCHSLCLCVHCSLYVCVLFSHSVSLQVS